MASYLLMPKYRSGVGVSLSQRVDITIQSLGTGTTLNNYVLKTGKLRDLTYESLIFDSEKISDIALPSSVAPSSSSGIPSPSNSRSNSLSEISKEDVENDRDSPSPFSVSSLVSTCGSDYYSNSPASSLHDDNGICDLSKRSAQCVSIIKTAKEKQEQEANKNAKILLEQLNQEKENEARKQAAQAKKRERKRQKRKAKQAKETTSKDDRNENCDSPPSERVSSEERREMWRLSSEYDSHTPSEARLPSLSPQYPPEPPTATTTSTTGQNLSSFSSTKEAPSSANGTSTSASTTSRTSKKKNRGRTKELLSATVSTVPTSNTSLKNSNQLSSASEATLISEESNTKSEKAVMDEKREKHRGKKQANRSGKRALGDNKPAIIEDALVISQVTPTLTMPTLISQVEDPWGDYEDDLLNEIDYNTWCQITGSSDVVSDDQWKTVPKRKTAIPVSKRDIGKVIGQNGATVKALRLHTGAHIDIEDIKEGSDITERSIHIRGQPESVTRAKELIEDLISGKLNGKDIATIASPRRVSMTSQAIPTIAPVSAVASVIKPSVTSTSAKVSKCQNASSNKPLPIRKVPKAVSQLQTSTTATNNNNNINSSIGGQVPWVNTGHKEEMNFASVAAAGVVTPNNSRCTVLPSSPSPESSSSLIYSAVISSQRNTSENIIQEAERFMASINSTSLHTPVSDSCGMSDTSGIESRLFSQQIGPIPDISLRDSSPKYMDGFTGLSSSPVSYFSHPRQSVSTTTIASKVFPRAPGSERHQRWMLPEQSVQFQHEQLPPNPSPLTDGASSTGGSTSSSIHESGTSSRFSATLDSSASTVQHSNTSSFLGGGYESSFSKHQRSGCLEHDIQNQDSKFSTSFLHNSSLDMNFQEFPRVVPNLNPQAQSFSPTPGSNLSGTDLYPISTSSRLINPRYITPPELKALPRIASDLNPSASTFLPQKPLTASEINSSQQRQTHGIQQSSFVPPQNSPVRRYPSPGTSQPYSVNPFGGYPYQGGLGESSSNNSFSQPDLTPSAEEFSSLGSDPMSSYLQSTMHQRPIGAERRHGANTNLNSGFPLSASFSDDTAVGSQGSFLSSSQVNSTATPSSNQPPQLWASVWAAPSAYTSLTPSPPQATQAPPVSSASSLWSTSWGQNGASRNTSEWD